MNSNSALADTFVRYFQLAFPDAADSDALREAYRIRYQVFCEELGFFKATASPEEEVERDEFDQRSSHCVVRHRLTGYPAGYVRLVHCGLDTAARLLPIEMRFHDCLVHPILHPEHLDRNKICEISRLSVHAGFRRRAGEKEWLHGDPVWLQGGPDHLRTFPLITVALFMGVLGMAIAQGREHAFAMMEPRLSRLVKASGFAVTKVGEPREYYGLRTTYHIDLLHALDLARTSPLLNPLYRAAWKGITGGSGLQRVAE